VATDFPVLGESNFAARGGSTHPSVSLEYVRIPEKRGGVGLGRTVEDAKPRQQRSAWSPRFYAATELRDQAIENIIL